MAYAEDAPRWRMREKPAIVSAAWSPDGKRIASSSDRTALIWSARSGETLSKRPASATWRTALAWSPDSKYLAVGGEEKTLQVWQT